MKRLEVECCDITCIHEEKVDSILKVMPEEEKINGSGSAILFGVCHRCFRSSGRCRLGVRQ